MKKGLLIDKILNEFYKEVRANMPYGTNKKGFHFLSVKEKFLSLFLICREKRFRLDYSFQGKDTPENRFVLWNQVLFWKETQKVSFPKVI